MINREVALNILKQQLTQKNLVKHCYAVEAILEDLADTMNKDKQLWGITGLLHDIDFEHTSDNHEHHGLVAQELLKNVDVPEETLYAIKAHNHEHTGCKPQQELDTALIAADAVSGLVIAVALIIPSKKLADVKQSTLRKKFKDNSFARGCDRERIKQCEQLGFSVDEFLALSLTSLQRISDRLGL